MSTAAEAKKLITLTSSDGETFQLDEAVAKQSKTIKHMIEDGCADDAIPLANVTAKILAKVIEYCNKHGGDDRAGLDDEQYRRDLAAWDAEFVKVDQGTLLELVLAANYLDIEGLMDLTCGAVAGMMSRKSVEEIREMFQIENDFTPEEEAEVRMENQWAFDD